ncbi:IclR family transcriptional regulator [Holophaga foetida]|uniref:IclR family transcriptional regulator n=1 Tax=Holophaga foetida TaxID=35839 RepID=UPI001FCC472F|nr:IclR family transcriptional regulator [Holophaga foetida]
MQALKIVPLNRKKSCRIKIDIQMSNPMKTSPKAPAPEKQNEEKTRVLSRAHDILMAIHHHPDGLTLREICNYTKLPRSTVQRILGTLEEQNTVITAPSSGLYRLGPTLTLLAENVRPFDIAKIARPMLMQIASKTDESVYLCVIAHGMAVVVDLIRGIHPIQTVTTMGTSLSLHATACGKALLAALPETDLEAMGLQHKLNRFTENTITNWDDLRIDLGKIRTTGIALDYDGHQVGTSAIAVPIKGPSGEIASISIPMPTERFHIMEEQLVKILRKSTQSLRWEP